MYICSTVKTEKEMSQNCVPLPGCLHGTCDRSYECNCGAGWKGIYCSKAICREGCHTEYGFCDRPGDCM